MCSSIPVLKVLNTNAMPNVLGEPASFSPSQILAATSAYTDIRQIEIALVLTCWVPGQSLVAILSPVGDRAGW